MLHTFTTSRWACVHMVRKQRVETYLDPETVKTLEDDYDGDVSAIIRKAVNQMLYGDEE